MTKITIAPSARTTRAVTELANDLIRVRINGATKDERQAQRAQAIRTLGKRTIANVIEIGYHLTEAKTDCGHGVFLSWLNREFGWSYKQAERFMQVYSVMGKFDNLSNLDVPISALYLLASPSTPEAIRQEVIERAERGEKFSVAEIKAAVEVEKLKKQWLSPLAPDPPPPTEIIFQISDLFRQLDRKAQISCLRRLREIAMGRA
jgi:hypothetical protein